MRGLWFMVVLGLATPSLAANGVPASAKKAARKLLTKAAKSKMMKAFKEEHGRTRRPLTGVDFDLIEKDGSRMTASGTPDGPATTLVRKHGAFAVLGPKGSKPRDAVGREMEVTNQPGSYGGTTIWLPVLELHFEVDLRSRRIRLELRDGGQVGFSGSKRY